MKKEVHKKTIDGIFEESDKYMARERYQSLLEDSLREEGYVPVLDLDTHWVVHWQGDDSKDETEQYNFFLSMYAVFTGRVKAQEEYLGYMSETQEFVKV